MEAKKGTLPLYEQAIDSVELIPQTTDLRIDLYRNLINSDYLNNASPKKKTFNNQFKPKFVQINSSIIKPSRKNLRDNPLETVHENLISEK